MADMYNKDYANDILRKLKQKIISENPEAVDALDAFAEEGAGEESGETIIEEVSLFDIEPEDEEDSEQEAGNLPEEDQAPEEEEDSLQEEMQSSPAVDIFDEEEDGFEDEDESQEDMIWETVPDADEDAPEVEDDSPVAEQERDDDIAPWDITPTFEEEQTKEEQESLPVPEETPKKPKSKGRKKKSPQKELPEEEPIEEDLPALRQEEILEESVVDLPLEEAPGAEEDAEASIEDQSVPSFVLAKKKRKIADDPEESVLVQKSEKQIDVLKRPLPRGQKVTRSSFFYQEKIGSSPEEEDKSNNSITAWRSLVGRAGWTLAALVVMVVLTLFSAALECIPGVKSIIFHVSSTETLNQLAMLLDSGCLLIGLLLFLPAIIQSVKRIRDGVFDGELATAAVAFLAFVYQLVSALVGGELFFVCFPFLFLVTASQFGRLCMAVALRNSAEICLNSHLGTTAVLRRASDLPEVQEALAESSAEHHVVMSTAKFDNPDAFLARLEKEYISSRYNWISLLGIAIVGIIAFAFAYIYQSPHALGNGLAVLGAAFPLSLFVVHHWSFFRLSRELRAVNMTVAGEAAVHELANADVVCLRDVDAFPPAQIKLTNIKLCDDKRLDLLFLRLNALFATLGGPLNGLFTVSGKNVTRPVQVSITEINPDGITAMVDGDCLVVGKGAYMAQKGIAFMYDARDEYHFRCVDAPIMFVATNGVSSAKVYLKYRMSEAFENYVRRLSRLGISVVIRTADPFITPRMIDHLSCLEKGTAGVVRSTVEAKIVKDALSSGLIGYSVKPQELYKTRFLFSAYRRMQKYLPWLSLAGIPLCGVLCALSVAAGSITLPLMIVLYQLLGTIPALCIVEAVLRKYNMGDKHHNDK